MVKEVAVTEKKRVYSNKLYNDITEEILTILNEEIEFLEWFVSDNGEWLLHFLEEEISNLGDRIEKLYIKNVKIPSSVTVLDTEEFSFELHYKQKNCLEYTKIKFELIHIE